LSTVCVSRDHGGFDCLFQVGVIKHNEWCLATQFEREGGDVLRGRIRERALSL
jgi:hypothetical protein